MSPIGSRIKLGVKVLLALIVAFVAWQFLQPDEDLHATIIVPSKLPAFGENDDVYAGLLGLEAPANSDFLAFGRAVREAMRRGEDILDAMERLSADREPLKPVFPPSMNCWLEPEMWLSGKAELGECGTFAEVEATLSQNAESIARYRAIQLLPTSVIGQWRAGATSIKLGKLLHLEIGKAIREGKREKALEIWRLHQVHQSRMVGSGDSWVAFAINLVNESMSQSALELLLDMDRRVARSESAVILAALGSGDLSRYDIAAQMRADYQLFERHALAEAGVLNSVKVNRLRNRYDDFAREFLAIAARKPPNIAAQLADLKSRSRALTINDFLDPRTARVWRTLIDLQLSNGELIRSAWRIEARRRQLALRVRIASEQIADDKIETFLESQKPEFCSPIDGRPFSYDANRRVLIDSAPAYRNIVETKL